MNVHITCPLWGESTGYKAHTQGASDAELLYFFFVSLHKVLNKRHFGLSLVCLYLRLDEW